MSAQEITDILIIGGGIVGLSVAREIKLRYPALKVTVLEKETEVGRHASGRNSGVLHSGIYYPPGSLKANLCQKGALEMAEYHVQNKLKLDRRGKVLVATRQEDAVQMDLLERRAKENGVGVVRLNESELKALEPEAYTATGNALWIDSTSVGSPADVMKTLARECVGLGVVFKYNERISQVVCDDSKIVLESGKSISYSHVVNAAGLYADKVAHAFGIAQRYTLLPFKGIYWKLKKDSNIAINHLVYPVPDLRVPFLGVHTITTTDGATYFGPTAVPAFGRENYYGLENIKAEDFINIIWLLGRQFVSGRDGFRNLVLQEGRRYFKCWFLDAARSIIPRLELSDLESTMKVGIRPQLIDREKGKLENDFVLESGASSTHVLNAISPAWTCAFPLARNICSNLEI